MCPPVLNPLRYSLPCSFLKFGNCYSFFNERTGRLRPPSFRQKILIFLRRSILTSCLTTQLKWSKSLRDQRLRRRSVSPWRQHPSSVFRSRGKLLPLISQLYYLLSPWGKFSLRCVRHCNSLAWLIVLAIDSEDVYCTVLMP